MFSTDTGMCLCLLSMSSYRSCCALPSTRQLPSPSALLRSVHCTLHVFVNRPSPKRAKMIAWPPLIPQILCRDGLGVGSARDSRRSGFLARCVSHDCDVTLLANRRHSDTTSENTLTNSHRSFLFPSSLCTDTLHVKSICRSLRLLIQPNYIEYRCCIHLPQRSLGIDDI